MTAAHGIAPAESRGATSIPAQVVARIAEQVASEVAHVGSGAGGVLGVGARRDFEARPSARCELYGRTAVLTLDVGVRFPTPLAPTLRALRTHLRERVQHLTGLEVGRLDISITWLHPTTGTRRTLR
ncbi:hypothetical protein CFK41_00225 [Brachybacterium ginsengisoli]|uniref:Asp23/Gls24 family envelope stress response protein n=1 Tax=Brachybacterium ginsengisoli TaxID=1331682 RepID=A0A291GTF3_9MICO|nr:hypothetical protein [Brachybacterium ginsengisoli]ATG53374.1 hypothetical protein CFK41_00225 [Brachybacterium ginsengisoli]